MKFALIGTPAVMLIGPPFLDRSVEPSRVFPNPMLSVEAHSTSISPPRRFEMSPEDRAPCRGVLCGVPKSRERGDQ